MLIDKITHGMDGVRSMRARSRPAELIQWIGWSLLGLFLVVLLAIYAGRKLLTVVLTLRGSGLMPPLVATIVELGEIARLHGRRILAR